MASLEDRASQAEGQIDRAREVVQVLTRRADELDLKRLRAESALADVRDQLMGIVALDDRQIRSALERQTVGMQAGQMGEYFFDRLRAAEEVCHLFYSEAPMGSIWQAVQRWRSISK